MALEYIIISIFMATANAAYAPANFPVVAEDIDPAPQYTFAYDVQDSITGDFKAQYETRNGDLVQGSYSLIEPDGSRRIVDYTSDPINGFNADVKKQFPAEILAAPAGPILRTAPIVAPAAPIVAPAAPILKPAPIVSPAEPVLKSFPYPPAANIRLQKILNPNLTALSAPIVYAANGYPF